MAFNRYDFRRYEQCNSYRPNDTEAPVFAALANCIGNCKAGDGECLPLTCLLANADDGSYGNRPNCGGDR